MEDEWRCIRKSRRYDLPKSLKCVWESRVGSDKHAYNELMSGRQLYSECYTSLNDGGFVVTWHSESRRRQWGVYGQRFLIASGNAIGCRVSKLIATST